MSFHAHDIERTSAQTEPQTNLQHAVWCAGYLKCSKQRSALTAYQETVQGGVVSPEKQA